MLPRRERSALAVAAERVLRAIALAAIALGAAVPQATALQLAVAAEGRMLTMQIAGHLVSVPGPLWAASAGQAAEDQRSQVVYNRLAPGVESVVFLPTDETIVTWTRMLGMLAVGRPGYSTAAHVKSIVEPLILGCMPDQADVTTKPAPSAGAHEGILLACGRYRLRGTAPRNCSGGIIAAVVLETSQGAMKAYQEWCTAAFDVADRATWPVPAEEVELRLRDLQLATKFQPAPSARSGWWPEFAVEEARR